MDFYLECELLPCRSTETAMQVGPACSAVWGYTGSILWLCGVPRFAATKPLLCIMSVLQTISQRLILSTFTNICYMHYQMQSKYVQPKPLIRAGDESFHFVVRAGTSRKLRNILRYYIVQRARTSSVYARNLPSVT